MLRRPTAIKMLDVDKVNDASIQRFEREVQLTCQLNNPNTVAIYDYGRTPEGVFYYAMEFLDGIDVQALVEKYGPQPEPRVIRILTQICGSLYEAHTLGLVHRDIKPANIMLNRRGCDADVVKVLDFGLVKAIDEQKQSSMTAANSLTGTPLYMPPEAIQTPNSVDAQRSVRSRRSRLFPAHGHAGLRRDKHRRSVPAARECGSRSAIAAARQAGLQRARARDPVVPGEVSRQAAAHSSRPGPTPRPLPDGWALVGRRGRRVVEQARTRRHAGHTEGGGDRSRQPRLRTDCDHQPSEDVVNVKRRGLPARKHVTRPARSKRHRLLRAALAGR